MVTKNDRKFSKFSTFVRFLGPFLKKQCFSKIGNFERDENFWMKLSAKLPHKLSWKMNIKCLGMTPHLMPPTPIFEKHCFFKNGPKKCNKSWKFEIFFCILGINFIRRFNDILHVSIFLLFVDKPRYFDWGWILICYRL